MNRCIKDTTNVYLKSLQDYEFDNVKSVLFPIFDKLCQENGFDNGYLEGKKVVIKPNLLAKCTPEQAVTTHPSFMQASCEYFLSKGAYVTAADSPGGVYNKVLFTGICRQTGIAQAISAAGAVLNDDYSFEQVCDKTKSKYTFNIIKPLIGADVVVNLCRLKTHALCEMTAAVKNMFGAIPGLQKAEQHARFSTRISFANMLCDLCLITAPQINITDAVVCMEGNGPSGGTLRKMGLVIASANPFSSDLLSSTLMGYDTDEVGTVQCAIKRGLCVDNVNKLCLIGENYKDYACKFVRPDSRAGGIVKQIPSVLGGHVKNALEPRPVVKKQVCVGCGICKDNCPVDAIDIQNKKAKINKNKCIRCYCCQEFCPKKAVKAKSVLHFW